MIPNVTKSSGYLMSDERRKMIGKVQFKKKKDKKSISDNRPEGIGRNIDLRA